MKKKIKRVVAVLLAFAIILQQDGLAGMTIDGLVSADEILPEDLEPEIVEDVPEDGASETLEDFGTDAAAESQTDSGADAEAEGQEDAGADVAAENQEGAGAEGQPGSGTDDSIESLADSGTDAAAENPEEPEITVTGIEELTQTEEILPAEETFSTEESSLPVEEPPLPMLKLDNSAQISAGAQVSPVALELTRAEGFPKNATYKMAILKKKEIASLTAGTAMSQAKGLALRFSVELNGDTCDLAGTTAVLDGLDASYLTGGHLSLYRDEDESGESGEAKWEELAVQFSENGDAVRASFSVDSDGVLFFWKDAEVETEETEEVESETMGSEITASEQIETETAESEMMEAEITEEESEMTEVETKEVESEMMETETAEPEMMETETAEPVMTEPEALESETAEPEIAESEPEIMEPEEPETAESESMEIETGTKADFAETETADETEWSEETEQGTEVETEAEKAESEPVKVEIETVDETDLTETASRTESAETELETKTETETEVETKTETEIETEMDELAYDLDTIGTYGLMQIADDGAMETYPVYEILYADGEMVFQNNAEIDEDKAKAPFKEGYPKIFHDDGSAAPDMGAANWTFNAVRSEIKTVTFKDDVPLKSLQFIFSGCTDLTQVNINDFKADDATSLARAFENCSALTSLDLSTWQTGSVKNMGYIFNGCTGLTDLNVSTWDTGRVTNLYQTFRNCSSLTTLNVSNWNTGNVTNMIQTFMDCKSLNDLDLGSWDTKSATDMYEMFRECRSLPSLDFSNWNTGKVGRVTNMFYNCSSLNKLILGMDFCFAKEKELTNTLLNDNWLQEDTEDTFTATDMLAKERDSIKTYYRLISITFDSNGGTPNTTVQSYIGAIFELGDVPDPIRAGFAFDGWWTEKNGGTQLNAGAPIAQTSYYAHWKECSVYEIYYKKTHELVFQSTPNVDETKVTKNIEGSTNTEEYKIYSDDGSDALSNDAAMIKWAFDDIRNEVEHVTFKDNVKLKTIQFIFKGCGKLKTVDTGDYDAAGVTSVAQAFYGCGMLKSLDLSKWDVSSATNIGHVFQNCKELATLDISGWNTNSVTNVYATFAGCSALTELDVSGWTTEKVDNMMETFSGCSSLNELNMNSWSTKAIKDADHMSNLFNGCTSLSRLTLGTNFAFKTSSAKNAGLSGSWQKEGETGEVYTSDELMNSSAVAGTYVRPSIYEILYSDGELVFQNDEITDPGRSVFKIYSDDGRNAGASGAHGWAFYTDRNRITSVRFRDNVKLSSLRGILYGYPNLISIDFGPYDASGVTNLSSVFRDCPNLTFLNLSGWNLSSATMISNMFQNCYLLTSVKGIENWNISNVDNMNEMFSGCRAMKTLDLSGWNVKSTGNVSMANLFNDCGALERLILGSGFHFTNNNAGLTGFWQKEETGVLYTSEQMMGNQANVPGTYIRPRVFEILYESGEMVIQSDNTPDPSKGAVYRIYEDDGGRADENVNSWAFQNDKGMIQSVSFRDNVKLRSLHGMFYGCENLTAVDTGEFDASVATSLGSAFRGCRSLTSLDLSSWKTSSVKDMSNMFQDCKSLLSIEGISNWDTSNVRNMNEMFRECNVLPALDLSGWQTAQTVSNKWNMFYNSNSLIKLVLGSGFRGSAIVSPALIDGWMRKTGDDYIGKDGTAQPFTGVELTNQAADQIDGTYYRAVRISFNGNGGMANPQGIDGYLDMKIAELPKVEREGYRFLGWYTEHAGGEPLEVGGEAKVLTYYAHWKPYSYNLRLYPQTGNPEDEITETELTFDQFYQLKEDLYKNEGKFLIGWNTKSNSLGKMYEPNARVFGLADQDGSTVNLYAIWGDPDDFVTLTFDTQCEDSEVSSMRFRKGEQARYLPKPLREGYKFDFWAYNPDGNGRIGEESYIEMTNDTTLYAQWLKCLTATFDPCAGDEMPKMTMQTTEKEPLGSLPKLSQRANGSTLIGWFTDPTEGVQIEPGKIYIKEDTTFYAHWGWRPQFDAAGGKFVENPDGRYEEESSHYTFEKMPTVQRDGYAFAGWFREDDATEVKAGDVLDLSKGMRIVAHWTPLTPVEVTLDPSGGTISGKKDEVKLETYSDMTLGDLPVPEQDGYVFQGWYDESGKLCDRSTKISGNMKLTAKWAEAVYVTFMDGDTVVKRLAIAKGSTIPSLPGYKKKEGSDVLAGWYTEPNGGGTMLTTDTPVNGNMTYYAKWREAEEKGSAVGIDYSYGVEWSNASNENVDNVGDRLVFHPTDTVAQTAQLHVYFKSNATSNTEPIPKGAVRIRIPKQVWRDWDGNLTGTNNVGDNLPKYVENPEETGDVYFAYMDDPDNSNYYILTNNRTINGGAGLNMTFSYTVDPTNVPGGGIDAAGNYVKGFEYYEETFKVYVTVDLNKDGVPDTDANRALSIEMHTRVETFASKEFSKIRYSYVWDEKEWGPAPADTDGYFYIEWKLKETVEATANQPFTFTWSEDNTVHDGTVLKITENDVEVVPEGYKTYYDKQKVLVRYPLSMLDEAKDGKLNIHNEAIVTEKWKSNYETSHRVSADYTIEVPTSGGPGEYEKVVYNTVNNASVHAPAQKHGGQEDILDDGKEVTLGWRIGYSGGAKEQPTWDETKGTYSTPERRICITDGLEDNLMYSSGSADGKYMWEPFPDNIVLSDEDYRLVSVKVNVTEYDAEYLGNGKWTGEQAHDAADYEGVDIFVRYKDSSELQFYRHAVCGELVPLPARARGIQLLHKSSFYWTNINVDLTVNLLPSDTICGLLKQDVAMNTTSIIKNWARCRVWSEHDAESDPYVNVTDYEKGKEGNDKRSAVRKVWELDVSDTYQYLCKSAAKQADTVVDVKHGTQDTPMCLTGWLYNNSSRIKQLRTGEFYDLLPMGTTVDPASVFGVWFTGNHWSSPGAPGKPANNYNTKLKDPNRLPNSAYNVEFVDNWEGSKRTMMIVSFALPEDVRANGVHIYYLLRTTYENIMENGSTQENDAAFVNTTVLNGRPSGTGAALDRLNAKDYFKSLDVKYNGTICYFLDSTNYAPVDVSTWGFDKLVKAETSASYSQKDTSLLNNLYTYRLTFSQGSGTTTKNIIFFDVLENGFYEKVEGQPGVRERVPSQWQGSFENINVESIKKNRMDEEDANTACNPVVYYSTTERDKIPDNVAPDLTNTSIWSTNMPDKPADVTAIAVDCSKCLNEEDFELKGEVNAMEIYITMRAPKDAEHVTETARNRAAVYMTHVDSEKQETGVMMDAGASVTLKDVEPELRKTSDPGSGTKEKPAAVYKDDPLTYTLSVTNVNKEMPLKNIVLEDTIPEGLSVQNTDIRVRFGDDKTTMAVTESPRVIFERSGEVGDVAKRKLKFTIQMLKAGETAYIEITGTVTAECETMTKPDGSKTVEKPVLENQAHITSVNDVDKNVHSEITYHEVQPIGFNISKTGVGGRPLERAELQLWKKAESAPEGEPLDMDKDTTKEEWRWTTDGTVKNFDNLEPGTYIIHEDTPPAGHLLAKDITVKLDGHNTLWLDDKIVSGVTMHDDYTKIRIEKKDKDGNAVEGAKLTVYESEAFQKDAATGKLTGPKLGSVPVVTEWTTNGMPHELDGVLDPGETYVLYEVEAPEGYKKADPRDFMVPADGSLSTVLMIDPNASFEVRVRKEDPEGNPLARAKLRISGEKETDTGKKEITPIEWETTLEDEVVRLYPGIYTLSEVYAPDGYAVADPIKFTVEEDGTNNAIVKKEGETEPVAALTLVMTDMRTQDLIVTKTVNGKETCASEGGTSGTEKKEYQFTLKLTRSDGKPFIEPLLYEKRTASAASSGRGTGTDEGGGTGTGMGTGTGTGTGTETGTSGPDTVETRTISASDGVYRFSLAGGESITFLDVPQDLEYEVLEIKETGANYVVTAENDTGTTGAEEPTRVKITNTYPSLGDLLISKTVIGSWAPKDETYTVEITPGAESTSRGRIDSGVIVYKMSSGAEGMKEMNDPEAVIDSVGQKITVKLKGGEQILVHGLTTGDYTVKEIPSGAGSGSSAGSGTAEFTASYRVDGKPGFAGTDGVSVALNDSKIGNVEVRNTYENLGELVVEKVVEGDAAPTDAMNTWYNIQVSSTASGAFRKSDTSKSYTLETVADTSGEDSEGASGDSTDGDVAQFRNEEVQGGVLRFQLRKDSKVKISGLPVGTYTVRETGAGAKDSYTASYTVTVKESTSASGASTSRGTVALGGEADGGGRITSGEVRILNRYPNKTSMNLSGTKTVIGKDLEEGKYYFAIEAVENPGNGTVLPGDTPAVASSVESAEVANSEESGAQFKFGAISFTKAGTYVFRVRETRSADPEVAKDGTLYTVTVTVETIKDDKTYAYVITKVVIARIAAGGGTAETVATYEQSFGEETEGSGGSSGLEGSGGSASEGSGGSASEGDSLIMDEDVEPIPKYNAFILPKQSAEDSAGNAVEATFINRAKHPLEMPDTGGPGTMPLTRTSIFLCLAGCFILLLAKRRKPRESY